MTGKYLPSARAQVNAQYIFTNSGSHYHSPHPSPIQRHIVPHLFRINERSAGNNPSLLHCISKQLGHLSVLLEFVSFCQFLKTILLFDKLVTFVSFCHFLSVFENYFKFFKNLSVLSILVNFCQFLKTDFILHNLYHYCQFCHFFTVFVNILTLAVIS